MGKEKPAEIKIETKKDLKKDTSPKGVVIFQLASNSGVRVQVSIMGTKMKAAVDKNKK